MTWHEIKKISEPHFYAIKIDKFLPKILRSILRKVFALGAVFFFFASFGSLPLDFSFADGVFFLCIFCYLLLGFLESFYRSMRFEGLYSRVRERALEDGAYTEYALSEVLYNLDEIDASRSLCETRVGLQIFERAGIAKEESQKFILAGRTPVIASSLHFGDKLSLAAFSQTLYEADKSLQGFLNAHSVNKEEWLGASRMVGELYEKKRRKERFWGRENLGAIPSIGTSWAYGVASDLGRFGVLFERVVSLASLDIDNGYRSKELDTLEGILERRSEANAIIIDDDESVVRDIVARLLKRIKLGTALPSIEHKSIVELDVSSLLASFKETNELQSEVLKLLNQAVSAGNIILYIRDLPGAVAGFKSSGVNLPSIISPFLDSDALQVIAHAGNSDFHFFIETNPTLLERFERIIPDEVGPDASLAAILERALVLEKEYPVRFSFGALHEVAISSDRYVAIGEMPGKALDMLVEIAPWASGKGLRLIRENDVASFVSEKTGVATGPLKLGEAEKIAKLEETLHSRVIGQELAVSSIASAIRRSRSGLTAPNRPIASFLFLGPTGVGKTEVSKSLAQSFFGSEESMLRLDMSEYNGPDALQKLLGSFAENRPGLLASRVRDNPYGVLLLDEFEKASREVHDLFLQILDEGLFTDALGKRVNCRNLMMIATSNAGSGLIWEAIKQGKNLAKEQSQIVEMIIKEKIFKPELINRFDAVVLFHPLQNAELRLIANLELQKLARRLKEQEMELVVTDELLNFLVEKGSDPQFGARSINRAVKNIVEDIVSRKILEGKVKAGDKIEITPEDLL